MANIEERVKAIIVEKLGCDESQVTLEASLTQDLGADSLDTVELMMQLENEFEGVKIPDNETEKIQTVGDIVNFIAESQKA